MSLRLGILTGDDVRHRYFVNALAERFDVVAVGYQNTGYVPADTGKEGVDNETARLVRYHFEERGRQEWAYFGRDAERLPSSGRRLVRSLDVRTLNAPATCGMLQDQGVDVVVVYGTGLIRRPLLDRFAGRIVNMHLGLSPYYRGTATNFYPLVNNEPEYVGATIHLIDAGIDSGPIVHHARPDITADDMPHTVGCKAIVAGIEKMIEALESFRTGRPVAVAQWRASNARVYFRKDYHPAQLRALYELVDAGLFPNYVERKHRVADAFRLIP